MAKRQPRASKETRQADAFIQTSDRLIRWLHGQRRVLTVLVAVLLVIGAGYGSYSWLKKGRETQ